jgi:hypothetical protein
MTERVERIRQLPVGDLLLDDVAQIQHVCRKSASIAR